MNFNDTYLLFDFFVHDSLELVNVLAYHEVAKWLTDSELDVCCDL